VLVAERVAGYLRLTYARDCRTLENSSAGPGTAAHLQSRTASVEGASLNCVVCWARQVVFGPCNGLCWALGHPCTAARAGPAPGRRAAHLCPAPISARRAAASGRRSARPPPDHLACSQGRRATSVWKTPKAPQTKISRLPHM
jgi:hypothetical protein